jgi:hypothetical protein
MILTDTGRLRTMDQGDRLPKVIAGARLDGIPQAARPSGPPADGLDDRLPVLTSKVTVR